MAQEVISELFSGPYVDPLLDSLRSWLEKRNMWESVRFYPENWTQFLYSTVFWATLALITPLAPYSLQPEQYVVWGILLGVASELLCLILSARTNWNWLALTTLGSASIMFMLFLAPFRWIGQTLEHSLTAPVVFGSCVLSPYLLAKSALACKGRPKTQSPKSYMVEYLLGVEAQIAFMSRYALVAFSLFAQPFFMLAFEIKGYEGIIPPDKLERQLKAKIIPFPTEDRLFKGFHYLALCPAESCVMRGEGNETFLVKPRGQYLSIEKELEIALSSKNEISFERLLSLDALADNVVTLLYHDHFTLKNASQKTKTLAVSFSIPRNAKNLIISDYFGELSVHTETAEKQERVVSVRLREPVESGQIRVLKISYEDQLCVSPIVSGQEFTLRYDLKNCMADPVKRFALVLVSHIPAVFSAADPVPDCISGREIKWEFRDLEPNQSVPLAVTVRGEFP